MGEFTWQFKQRKDDFASFLEITTPMKNYSSTRSVRSLQIYCEGGEGGGDGQDVRPGRHRRLQRSRQRAGART
jgi:hypothetical protein